MDVKYGYSRVLALNSETHFLPLGLLLVAFTYSLAPGHSFSDGCFVVLFLTIFFATCIFFGRTLARLMPVPIRGIDEFPALFLMGFFCFSTVMFVFCFISPFPIVVSFFACALLAIYSQCSVAWKKGGEDCPPLALTSPLTENIGILVVVCAMLIWTQPDRRIYVADGNDFVFPQWVDAFIHSGIIATFSEARNCLDLQNAWMAGTRLFLYHYAGYMPSAVLIHITHYMPMEIYSRFYLPSAFLITTLSAYVLARQWWSAEAAVGAMAALILIPDASWHGIIGDPHYGFYWLLHASAGLGFGIGLLTLAWIIMLSACVNGNFMGVLVSFICGGLVLAFKAQLFVGSALLLWLFPIFFLKKISIPTRGIWLLGALTITWASLYVIQHFKGVPDVGVNGGGEKVLVTAMKMSPVGGPILNYLGEYSIPSYLLAAAYLFLAVLGFWGLLWLGLIAIDPASKVPRLKFLFPLLVVLNFIIINLALDPTSVDLADEFSHRPFVWPYFVVVTCVSASLYALWVENAEALISRRRKFGVMIGLGLCFIFPVLLNQRIINPMHWRGVAYIHADGGFVACGRFIAQNSNLGDIIQAGNTDPNFVLTSITGRREWVTSVYYFVYAQGLTEHKNDAYAERLAQAQAWNSMTDAQQIRGFALKAHIRWVVIDSNLPLHWPKVLLDNAVFVADGYKVIRFF